MHDAIAYLKNAAQRGPGVRGAKDCYIVNPDSIRASNDWLHAGIDWASGASFVLPADAVDVFLARTTEITDIKVSEKTVLFKSGRLQSTIERRFEEPEPAPVLPDDWLPVPEEFTEKLKIARNFINEGAEGPRIWQAGVRIWNERITACSGSILIDIETPGLIIERPKILSKDTLDFLIAQGDPDEFGIDRNTISFRWDDGRWVRCKEYDTTMPEEIIKSIFSEKGGTEAPVTINDDWKIAHADAAHLGDGSLRLTVTGFQALKDHIVSDISLSVDVPTDHSSWWSSKDFGNMIAVAKSWNPLAWPDPALFVGNGFKGVIVGVKR